MLVLLKRNGVKMSVLFLFQASYKYFRVWSKRPGNRKFVQSKMVILARHCPLTGRYFQPCQQHGCLITLLETSYTGSLHTVYVQFSAGD